MPSDLPDVRTQTRCVSLEYLEELYEKSASLITLRRWIDACARGEGCTPEEARILRETLDRKYGPIQ